jgi:hypothetical protein
MEESGFGRVVSVLISPGKTFRAIAEKPTWVAPLLVLIVLGVLSAAMMSGKMDWGQITRDSIAAKGQEVPEEQLETIIDFQEKAGPIFMYGGSILGQPVVFLLIALVFLVVFKMLGGELTFKKSFSVIVHSMMPRALMGVLSIPVILGKSEFGFEELKTGSLLTSNLGAFAPEDASSAVVALLSSVDVFSIWVLALLVIGFGAVAKVSKGAAAAGVIGLWVVYVLGKVGFSALGG